MSFEYQAVRVSSVSPAVTVINIYRPPNTSITTFCDELVDFLSAVVASSERLLICGDFNCPGLNPSSINTDIAVVLDMFSLSQYVQEPTRNDNLLDLLVSDAALAVSHVRFDDAGLVSDHRLVAATVSTVVHKNLAVLHASRRLNNIDVTSFEKELRETSLFTQPASTVDGFADQFEREVVAVLDRFAPVRRRRRRPSKPITRWLSQEAVDAKRCRRRLERRWRSSHLDSDRVAYRRGCRQANKLINDSRRSFFRDQLSATTDIKDRWRVAKQLLHSGKTVQVRTPDENVKLCNRFSEFFVDKIQSLKRAVASETLRLPAPAVSDIPHNGCLLNCLSLVTADEVSTLIRSLPAKSSPLDFVPTSLIKSCHTVFSELIAQLANLSFSLGFFPSKYKSALISPLLKKPGLDESNPANYRPISNLNNISKILERLFLSRLQSHLCTSSNFSPFQSAYRRHYSTETALLHTLNDVYCAADAGKPTVLVSLDLSAAFDTIDHLTLLHRLQSSFGISGTVLSWLHSYISGRSQSVRVGSASSSSVSISAGVPQGSVLGPMLFSCYISPIASIVSSYNLGLQQYADDTQVYLALTATTITYQLTTLSNCLSALHTWFSHNGLSLNASKSEAILFGTRQRLRLFPPITSVNIAGSELPLSDTITVLGLTLDRTLTFYPHIAKLCKSSHFHIRALRHIRSALSDDMATSIAVALIQSRLDYANSVLFGTTASNIHKLQSIQNTISRIVLPRLSHLPASSLLSHLHWLPIHLRIEFKLALITYNTLANSQPTYLRSLLVDYRPARSLRSSDQQLLVPPPLTTNFGRRAFCSSVPRIWNKIPLYIRSAPSSDSFKRHLKTFYFDQLDR